MSSIPLLLIVVLPLIGFIINGVIGARLPKPAAGVIGTLAVFAAFVVAVLRFAALAANPPHDLAGAPHELVYAWITAGAMQVNVSLMLDQLSGVMVLIITGISFLIHLYSVGYMAHDHNDPEGKLYARYFAFLNLFVAFMTLLVLADNFLVMFVGWEGVGLCSYFLIGYWFKREDAAEASKKAFIVNRIGDFGFLLAMMLIFVAAKSLDYVSVFNAVLDPTRTAPFTLGVVGSVGGLSAIAALLFIGATGKSAQIPLFTWLPDAMAGPTPVSALIHAATMVTAGVYMTARCSAIFDAVPNVKLVICCIGAATALCAALTALAHNDIKKVLAYSTVSQLGYMFMAVGAGAYVAAIFHVFTHAFFKACLFLGSGSVIHALHGEQDMRKMGGLVKKMKATNLTFLVSGLALAGAVPFAGFFSKDEILSKVFEAGGHNPIYYVCLLVGLVTSLITGLYTGRQYAQVFLGKPRDEHLSEHAHESSAIMTIPLWILGIGAVVVGFLGVPKIPGVPESLHAFANWLEPVFAHPLQAAAGTAAHVVEAPVYWLLALGGLLGWVGWIAGRSMGVGAEKALLPESTEHVSLDEAYNHTVVRGGFGLASLLRWIDDKVVDGLVNGIGLFIGQIGTALRLTQTSFVRNYALAMALGAIVVLAYFVTRS
jgi:NADH-quinone oxidoreductase subunit L